MKLRTIAAVAGASTLASSELLAQCSGWLPNVAMPTEFSSGTSRAYPTTMIGFDFDGPGPEPESLVVSGFLGPTVPDGRSMQRFDGRRWIGMGVLGGTRRLFIFDSDGPGPLPPQLHRDSAGYIARLNGQTWELLSPALLTRPGGNGDIRAGISFDPDGDGPRLPLLIIGGRFTNAGQVSSPSVIAWDGTQWLSLGGGLAGGNPDTTLVNALKVFDPDGPGPRPQLLIAGGSNTTSGANINAWDGTRWTRFGSTVGSIYAFDLYDRDGPGPQPPVLLAAGGPFTSIDGVPANSIAYHDGTGWNALGEGIATRAETIVVFDPDADGPRQQMVFASQYDAPMRVWDGETWSTSANSPIWATPMTVLRNAPFSDSPQLIVGATAVFQTATIPLARFALSNTPPQITTQPPAQLIVRPNAPAELTITATGDELTFRWFRNSLPFDEGRVFAGVRTGVFSPTLRFEVPAVEHTGTYYVEVGNACGLVRSQSVNVVVVCVSDFNSNLSVDFFDYLDFLAAFSAQDPAADLDNNGQVDFTDYLAFVQAFSAGC